MQPNNLTALDFEDIKASIKSYLRSRNEFTDYDFEGSSLTVLIDALAYNTYYTAVNANLAVNEGFLETAVLRENVVKLARMIGYTPRSARSARAIANIQVQTTFPYPKSVTIAAGLVLNFTGLDNNNFVFSIPTDVTQSVDSLTGIASFNNTVLFEGLYLQDTFVKNTAERQRFILTNERVDTTSLVVQVTSGTITEKYLQATDITKIDANSKVYFLEESEYQIPEILFGDGVVGKALSNGDVVTVKYTTSGGTGANGLKVFENIGTFRDNLNNAITSGISLINC